MGCFILHKTWNISTLFTRYAFWEEYFCTVVAEHCFLCYYQTEKVKFIVRMILPGTVVPSSNHRSRFVYSQLVCLLSVGIFNHVIHLIHKWRNARKSLGRVHESEAKGASDSNENKAEYGNASSTWMLCLSFRNTQ